VPDGATRLPLVDPPSAGVGATAGAGAGGEVGEDVDGSPTPDGGDVLRAVGPASGHRQTPGELAAFKGFAECIDCMLCYAACPQLDVAPDFLGPAVVATASPVGRPPG